MSTSLLHVYRNTSMGRETYLHSLYFCKMLNIGLVVYIPDSTHFTMNLDNETIRIDLDESYLTAPDSAAERVRALAASNGTDLTLLDPQSSPDSQLSELPHDFSFMTCPRSISDLSSKIGLGFIGARVRQIVCSAGFPVLITGPVFKPWRNITVLFGGSDSSISAVRLGIYIARRTGCALNMLTYLEEDLAFYKDALASAQLTQAVRQSVEFWHRFDSGLFEDRLYAVPHDAFVIVGAYGHGRIKDLIFGSKLEKIQQTLTNNLLVVGPKARIPDFLPPPALTTEAGKMVVATPAVPAERVAEPPLRPSF